MADPETDLTLNGESVGNRGIEIDLPKRGRGRPRKDGSAPATSQKSSSPARPAAREDSDAINEAAFIGTGMVALVELAESFVHNNAARKIEKARPEKLAEFKDMANSLALQDKEKETISKTVGKIALRHEWATKYAPEFVLCVFLGQYGLRQMQLLKFVNNVTKDTGASDPVDAVVNPGKV